MQMLRGLGDWFDERTGWRASLDRWLDAPGAGDGIIGPAIGAAITACFVLLVVTGVVLMTGYAASPQAAWASVHYIQFVQSNGWILRGLHYWATQSLLVLAALHIVYGTFAGSYRTPREIGWWLTLVALALALGGAITGGLLPWDQRGWWARVVEANIVGLAPVIGGWLSQTVSGGSELGALGLARAYAVHVVVLPILLGVVIAARIATTRKAAALEPSAFGRSVPRVTEAARGVVVGVLVTLVLLALTRLVRAPLDAPADPMSDYPARPEWFLLSLFQLRKLFHGPLEFWGTTQLPALAGLYFAALPWIDRPPRSRVWALTPALAIMVGALVLGGIGWYHDARDVQYQKARARWDARADAVEKLAMDGVPPAGPVEMARRDPELRGRDLFERHCASCHVLGDLGDPTKATATRLDGWGTAAWIQAMMHDPDAPEFFGRGPYKEMMPSVDVRPKNDPPPAPWTPMIRGEAEMRAVTRYLASLGSEPGDPTPARDAAGRAEHDLGEKIVSERCTSCHLFKGEGDDEGTGNAPELSGYGSVAWTRAQVANPSQPSTYRDKALDPAMKKHMPRFDKDLSEADVDIVARWTRLHGRATALVH